MSLCDIIKLENRKYKLIPKTSVRFEWERVWKAGGMWMVGMGETPMSATKSIESGRHAVGDALMRFSGLEGLEYLKLMWSGRHGFYVECACGYVGTR